MGDAISNILNQRGGAQESAITGEKFYSYLLGDGIQLHFLEIQKSTGDRLCLRYEGLSWFYFSPEENNIKLDFDGTEVQIKGRGLNGKLFTGFQQKRIAWIKERDSEFQDNPQNEIYIEEIIIIPPGAGEEES